MPYHLNYENLDSSDLYSFKFSGPEAGSVHRPCERSGSKAGSVHHTRRKTRIWGSQLLQILGFDVAWGHLTSPGKNCCIKMVFLTKFWGVLRFWSFDIAWEKGAPVAVKIFYKYMLYNPPPLSLKWFCTCSPKYIGAGGWRCPLYLPSCLQYLHFWIQKHSVWVV